MTELSQILMEDEANGSLLILNDQVRGSYLLAQKFEQDKYFWVRPSAGNYQTLPSTASNLGPTSAKLKKQVEERVSLFMRKHAIKDPALIPSSMVYASGSGLDPHIMVNSAILQLERVAKARKLDTEEGRKKILELILKAKTKNSINIFGRECINVLILNQSLDELKT